MRTIHTIQALNSNGRPSTNTRTREHYFSYFSISSSIQQPKQPIQIMNPQPLFLLVLLLARRSTSLTNCNPSHSPQSTCHSIPPCASNLHHPLFDLTSLPAHTFANCTITQPVTLQFTNLAALGPLTFSGLTIAANTMLTIKISPANRTTSLRIEAHAFAGLALNEMVCV